MKEYGEFGEMELRDLTSEPYTIKVKYHEGASRIGGDIHGVMCDLAASETVELKQGEVKIIPLGVSMKLLYGDFGIVVPRSSTCLKHGIMMANSIGIIENEYCGDGECLYADCASGNCGDCRFDSRQLEPQDCCIDHIFGDIARRIRALREVR